MVTERLSACSTICKVLYSFSFGIHVSFEELRGLKATAQGVVFLLASPTPRTAAIITFVERALPMSGWLWPPARARRCPFLDNSVAVVSPKQKMLPCASEKAQEPFQAHSCKAEQRRFCAFPLAVSLHSWLSKGPCRVFLGHFPSPDRNIPAPLSSLLISLQTHQKRRYAYGCCKISHVASSDDSSLALQCPNPHPYIPLQRNQDSHLKTCTRSTRSEKTCTPFSFAQHHKLHQPQQFLVQLCNTYYWHK